MVSANIDNIRHRTRLPRLSDAELEEQRLQRERDAEERQAVRVLLRRARKGVQKNLDKIERLAKSGEGTKLRLSLRTFLKSYNARIWASEKAYRRVHGGTALSMQTLDELASNLNVWERPEERVQVYHKRKKDGSIRKIMNFGVQARAQQYLVKAVAERTFGIHETQFGVRGGRDEACRQTCDLIESHRLRYAVVADIKDCFGSFSEEGVRDAIPLIKTIAEAVVLPPPMELTISSPWFRCGRRSLRTVRGVKGLPQGSAVSNLVAEVMLAPVFERLEDCAIAIGYCDDILLLSRTRRGAEIAREALLSCLRQLPAGPLSLGSDEVRRISDGFEFLGYRFGLWKGRPVVTPPLHQLRNFDVDFELAGLGLLEGEGSLADLRNKVSGWHGSYRLWKGAERSRQRYLEQAETYDVLGRSARGEAPRRRRRRMASQSRRRLGENST